MLNHAILILLLPLASAVLIAVFLRKQGALASWISTGIAGAIAAISIILLQHGEQIRLADEGTFMRQQHLEPLARDRRRIAPAEHADQIHATALRPNSRAMKPPRRCAGTFTTKVSPRSRRAASK